MLEVVQAAPDLKGWKAPEQFLIGTDVVRMMVGVEEMSQAEPSLLDDPEHWRGLRAVYDGAGSVVSYQQVGVVVAPNRYLDDLEGQGSGPRLLKESLCKVLVVTDLVVGLGRYSKEELLRKG